MAPSAAIDDVRLSAGLYDIREAARLIDLPEQTFRRWARVYEHGAPLLHMRDRDRVVNRQCRSSRLPKRGCLTGFGGPESGLARSARDWTS
jgi:hypothetical protein